MNEVWRKLGIFEGEGPSIFNHSISLIADRTYFLAGVLFTWSVLHGGPGLLVFPKEVISWLIGEKVHSEPDIDLIPDILARNNIRKVSRD